MEELFENIYNESLKKSDEQTNIEYHNWSQWVRDRNPEPNKFHNKFSKDEKYGIWHGGAIGDAEGCV